MPTSMKRTVLTQELLRVMLRCSPILEWSRVTEHLNDMMKRLQFSGYDQRFRAHVLKAAFRKTSDRKMQRDDGRCTGLKTGTRKAWNRRSRRKRAGSEKEGRNGDFCSQHTWVCDEIDVWGGSGEVPSEGEDSRERWEVHQKHVAEVWPVRSKRLPTTTEGRVPGVCVGIQSVQKRRGHVPWTPAQSGTISPYRG